MIYDACFIIQYPLSMTHVTLSPQDLTRLNEFGYFEGWPLSVKYHTQRIDAIARKHAQLQRGAVQRYKKARHVYEKEKEHGRAEEKGGERKSDGESEKGTKTDDSRNPPPSSSVSSTSASASSASASSTASALPPLPGPTPTPRFFHGLEGGVDRYHVNDITAGEFRAWYEQRKVPVLLQGGMDDWELSKVCPAMFEVYRLSVCVFG